MKIIWHVPVSVLLACSPIVAGQVTAENYERQLELFRRQTQVEVDQNVPPQRRAYVDYGAYATFSYLSLDDPAGNNRGLREYDLIGYGRVNLDDVQQIYVRGRTQYFDYNPGDSFDGHPDHLDGYLEEAYYQLDLDRLRAAYGGHKSANDDVAVVKAGRQFVQWATGLTLEQYMDGITARFGTPVVSCDFLAGVTVPETVDFDTSRPKFNTDTERGFFGLMPRLTLGTQQPYAYALLQRDFNPDNSAADDGFPTRYSYDSYYLGAGSHGSVGDHFIYDAEGTYEGGSTLSNSFSPADLSPTPQGRDTIEAFAAQLTGTYLFNDAHRSQLSGGVIIASGDKDRGSSSNTFGGNAAGTDDHAFNALGLLDTGLVFAPDVTNLIAVHAQVSTYVGTAGTLGRAQVGAQCFLYWKYASAAPIDEPSNSNSYLGVEPEVFVNWQIIEDVTLQVRYGVLFPGGRVPDGEARQGFYGAITYAF